VLQPTELLRKLRDPGSTAAAELGPLPWIFAPHSALRAKVVAGASACARTAPRMVRPHSPSRPRRQPARAR